MESPSQEPLQAGVGRRKIDALTSLRFFAASTIVLHHSRGLFRISPDFLDGYTLDQAVAFFFVLSGFILTYVHPTLAGVGWKRFIVSRFARIWPAHIAALVLLFGMLPWSVFTPTGRFNPALFVGNILMVQAWFPLGGQVYSYNSPSWSISTEFGFYLLFPLLIRRWEKTWHVKLLLSFGLMLGMVTAAAVWLPEGRPASMTVTDLVYTHPLARLFEFTLGMTAALAWRRLAPRLRLGRAAATALELAALTLATLPVAYSGVWAANVKPVAGGIWLVHGGFSCIPFAVLIIVVALDKGWVSRLLATPLLVYLGEISYSIYLVHHILLRAANEHGPYLSAIPPALARALYVVLVLIVAHLTWRLVEQPARRGLVALYSAWSARSQGERPDRAMQTSPRFGRSLATGALALGLWGLAAYAAGLGFDQIGLAEADGVAAAGVPAVRGVRFGDSFELLGVQTRNEGEWVTVDLLWKSLRDQTLEYRVAVHLMDGSGTIWAQADYWQSFLDRRVRKDTIWRERTTIPRAWVRAAPNLGLAIYNRRSTLTVDRGARDWDNHRLILSLPTR